MLAFSLARSAFVLSPAAKEKRKDSPCPTLADQYLPIGATFSGMPQGP